MPLDPLIGTVIPWGPNFAPRGWAFCEGQLLAIAQNTALFSILGTTYGGNGRTNFGLPDLRSRYAMHPGSGPGLPTVRLGQRGGVENVVLNPTQIPNHSHAVTGQGLEVLVSPGGGDQALPAATHRLADAKFSGGQDINLFSTADPDTTIGGFSATAAADDVGGEGHSNIQPFLGTRYIIALVGVFPSRN